MSARRRVLFAAGRLGRWAEWARRGEGSAAGEALYIPMAGCSGCPYRADPCHAARMRVMDAQLGEGRHYLCDFHRSIRAARGAGTVARRGVAMDTLLRMLGSEG